jgi:hypothetical protein
MMWIHFNIQYLPLTALLGNLQNKTFYTYSCNNAHNAFNYVFFHFLFISRDNKHMSLLRADRPSRGVLPTLCMYVTVRDLKTTDIRRPWPALGCCAKEEEEEEEKQE